VAGGFEFWAVSGYQYEPWHIRYLGKDLAPKVFESKLTYDEYCEKENTKKNKTVLPIRGLSELWV